METVYDLNYDEMSDENVLEAMQYLDDNVSHFDIVKALYARVYSI